MTKPTIGRIVHYRSRTGAYTVPAIVVATTETLNPIGVKRGFIPALSSDQHVHLVVFTGGKPGMREAQADFEVESSEPISENVAGCYQEWDIPEDTQEAEQAPATWRWPQLR